MAESLGTYEMRKFDSKQVELVLTIKETKEFRLRMWLARQLVHLAAMVLSMGYKEEIE